jgi:superfamily II RNA helicase
LKALTNQVRESLKSSARGNGHPHRRPQREFAGSLDRGHHRDLSQQISTLRGSEQVQTDLVVLDEAHYLADEDRGHVWEEAIILTPPRIRLLLLSATIGNAEEFAGWIAEVRGVNCGVVTRPGARPVPLRAAFLMPDKRLVPLIDHGKLNPEIAGMIEEQDQRQRGRWERGKWGKGKGSRY